MGVLKCRIVPVLLSAALVLISAPVSPAARYIDSDGSWAAEVIQKAGDYALMEGYPDGRFGVGELMTRAQFVTVLCRMFGWALSDAPSPTHSDCQGHWALPYINAAAAHGAIDPDGAFRPNDPVSRMEMAQMLVSALGYGTLAQSLEDAELPFADVTEHRGYAAVAYHLGIITGVDTLGQLNFLPSLSAPREQAAAMLVRCYERLHSQTQWLHGFYAFSSYPQLSYAGEMDAVSVGWARLEMNQDGPRVNSAAENGNEWVKPQQYQLATDYFEQSSVPYNLNVFAPASTFADMTTAGAQGQAVEALAAACEPYAGLTMDVEGLRDDHRENYTAFLSQLRAALPDYKCLYVCVQPDTWYGGFDYRALGEICDKVILMAHDYQWTSIPDYYLGTDNTYCPVTPIDQVYTALAHITDPETGVRDRDKLALQISFGSAGFHVDENGLLLDDTLYHPATETIARRLGQSDSTRVWDDHSRNPCLTYTADDGERYRLWYEDAQSVEEKLTLARLFGITGVSVWRLGAIPDDPDVPFYDVWGILSK